MKKYYLLLFLTLPLLFNFTEKDDNLVSKIRFVKNNLDQVKRKAETENKPFFVDFTASWCMPCRWMDETTFSDPNLTEFINKNYLAVKVDVDDFDGYAYKQQYNIKMLPSIMVFSPEGEVVARYQESMSPSKLLGELKKYQVKTTTPAVYNSTQPQPQLAASRINTSPTQVNAQSTEKPVVNINISVTGTDQPVQVTSPQERPVVTYDNPIPLTRPRPQSQPQVQSAPRPQIKPTPRPQVQQAPRPQRPTIMPAPSAAKPPTYVYEQPANVRPQRMSPPAAAAPARPIATGDGLFRLSVARQHSEGFSVQTGVYGDYQNVLREVDKLQKMFDQPVIVHVDAFKGQRVYKVMIGEFKDRGSAINYLEAIKYHQIVGFVQNLSTMQ
ncbi:MAG: thioredoxin family protein [Saprospiraceae bacterium]